MKYKVSLYNSGSQFDEVVNARDNNDAIRIATSRNPSSRVVSVTRTFKDD